MASASSPFTFSGRPYVYDGKGAWVFIALPKKTSKEIRQLFKKEEQGWGRLSAVAKIGTTEWKTAIWYDSKQETYLLPLKNEIRMAEGIQIGKAIKVNVFI